MNENYLPDAIRSIMNFRNWRRFDYKQAEFTNVGRYTLFKSYNTIVGIAFDGVMYELGKYSRTTSKQVSQFCAKYGYERQLLERPDADIYCKAQNY